MSEPTYDSREPIAIVGFACRLPGGNYSPPQFWEFLKRGEIAYNKVPESRFNHAAHYDGSLKPRTMRQPGGMFLKDIDLADFDAKFFELSATEATAMDPAQRQMLEVVYEGLENAGIPLDKVNGQSVGCYVGNYASDYGDMGARDPEDRSPGHGLGIARTILANRISHFLNIHGPSVTLDTACSSSLVGLDLACQALRARSIDTGIVAAANVYMSPEHLIDAGGVGGAHSLTALCHTFDAAADGYVKAEAVNTVIIKRLSDAVRDRDPIRAVVLGTSSNHNGRTMGIASPSADAQAMAIRAAYANAGITDFNKTAFFEFHGTATQAGDAAESQGAASVFSASRSAENPLIIGSVKSNVGHSEPAAGLTGLMKAVLAIENGVIPGNPTFINPSPKIDFVGNKMKATRTLIPWPTDALRRASVNSFGIGGSNAHAIVEAARAEDCSNHVYSYRDKDGDFTLDDDDDDDDKAKQTYTLVLSANDSASLAANIRAFCAHLINPNVKVDLADLAYTLSERRSRLFHRAFVSTKTTDIYENLFTTAKKSPKTPKVGFLFTGQGAQWPRMGKALVDAVPWIRTTLEDMDKILQSLPNPPEWSLVSELMEPRSAEHVRQPDMAQPLVAALQMCLVDVLRSWGIKPSSVLGHSSGEGAAAYAAGWMSRSDCIKCAFYRGQAAKNISDQMERDVGMLALGLGAEAAAPFLEKHRGDAFIACYNSPSSLTISGRLSALDSISEEVKAAGYFARALLVDMAYHTPFMAAAAEGYQKLLDKDQEFGREDGSQSGIAMFSSVTGLKNEMTTGSTYWKNNMISPVRFDAALEEMLKQDSPDMLIEIGPAGALAGPVSQLLKSLANAGNVSYCTAWSRGANASKSLFDVAGHLFATGGDVDLALVNRYNDKKVRTVVDLPNYTWNHDVKYWHESAASKDWRFRKFPVHDLLGSKVLGAPWHTPVWRNRLNASNVPWIMQHKMGGDAIMPAAGYLTIAVEALFQKLRAIDPKECPATPNELCYCFRNVRFQRAMVVEEDKDVRMMVTLNKVPGSDDWHEFRISSTSEEDVTAEHCFGLVRTQDAVDDVAQNLTPPKSTAPVERWYKATRDIGMGFGPVFKRMLQVESTSGVRACRVLLTMEPPASAYSPQSYYPVHPAALDGCFQTPIPANMEGEIVNVRDVMIPTIVDEVVINKVPKQLNNALAEATSVYSGRGRPDQDKSWVASSSVVDSQSGALMVRITGLHYIKLDVPPTPDPHVFDQVTWVPDVSLLTQDQLLHLDPATSGDRLNRIIDLVAYKKPALRVLEVHLDEEDTSCLWFDAENAAYRQAYARYDFVASSSKPLASVSAKHEGKEDSGFSLMRLEEQDLGLESPEPYDLALVKLSKTSVADDVLRIVLPLLSTDACTLVVRGSEENQAVAEQAEITDESEEFEHVTSSATSQTGSAATPLRSSGSDDGKGSSSIDSAILDHEALKIDSTAASIELGDMTQDGRSAYLLSSIGSFLGNKSTTPRTIVVPRLSGGGDSALTASLRSSLESAGWLVEERTAPFQPLAKDEIALVLDELTSPLLRHANQDQWDAIKALVSSGNPVLWVTKGAQSSATDPDHALVYGLFRVARREDQGANLTILDVQSSTGHGMEAALDKVLRLLAQGAMTESEVMEREGILHIQRVVPDVLVNEFKRAETEGMPVVSKSFHGNEVQVQLRAERLGTLEGLTWCETESQEPSILEDHIEVEIMAVGVNFKDVAVTMGVVPDNEYSLGYECAGVVRRLGPAVKKFRVGDRVCMLKQGSHANRIRVHIDRCHVIPETMSYEDAATIPCVYLTSLYALYHLASLQEGQSVLIHSATGGIGIACIELARHKQAEIYVTVGTEEKRQFLEREYGIPRSRMFSSRSTKFAGEIMQETNGRGVDVIVNSLIGELLDASWRILADGGIMVEIGKRDIVNRNTLAMEPFDRNCSFRAVDLSYTKHFNEPIVARLLTELFILINAGHIRPIHPVTTYAFEDVPAALAYIRTGRHLGKIVITNKYDKEILVPTRPAVRPLKLSPDVSYLIVGGLKGLCSTLAVHMAQHGARHIVVSNRSGISDEVSAKVVRDCMSYGCRVTEAKGDIGNAEFVRRLVQNTFPRLGGIVQGAMALNDTSYESMTKDQYRDTIYAKVEGTWNLHNATQELLKQPLDFFTMLSSTSGVAGRVGQANYAAANTFLDAFASWRQRQGLCGNSVNLGLIEDIGYVAEDETGLDAKINRAHWVPIYEGMLRRIFTYSVFQQDRHSPLNKESSAQLVTGIAYPYPQDGSDTSLNPRFSHLCSSRGADRKGASDGGDGGDDIDQGVRNLLSLNKSGVDIATLTKACTDVICLQFARILRLGDAVEPGKSPMSYGLDSLSGVELRNWVRNKLDVTLSTLDIVNATSILALVEKIVAKMLE
ncbi:beta-ketoacyl synthase domain-containing protein [Colletotrichum graminicola]|uniref:Beta-ketoacyl synthase domain-containing protein n=1 Tax=Colletotrichum graminicola (strain M1.001 / M2 / FGSC 10212) TaxID=645133 RepID=E3QX05_COLGM|nr:beta-ketoacyl synthase domain-containing protein [Colletotrichum graminicola M1.001]EFQ35393.1 beta-ketoacyl synthase domain-containing protein [Colletotrichum graminicola M1.001]WDK14958.1 beta-ketoacyl synthase domain-containing protein [Colletotrichum graminicola]